jgi:hypothetical protein
LYLIKKTISNPTPIPSIYLLFFFLSFHLQDFFLSLPSLFLSSLYALSSLWVFWWLIRWLGRGGLGLLISVWWLIWWLGLALLRSTWGGGFVLVDLHWVWVFAEAHHQIGLGFGSLRWWVCAWFGSLPRLTTRSAWGLGLCAGGFALGLGLCRGSPPDRPGVWVFALVGC